MQFIHFSLVVDTFHKRQVQCQNGVSEIQRHPFAKEYHDIQAVKTGLSASYSQMVETSGHTLLTNEDLEMNLLRVSRWIVESSKAGLIIFGTYGNGKTTMLAAMQSFLQQGVLKGADTIWELQQSNLEEDIAKLAYYETTPLLFLDDLGAENQDCRVFGVERAPIDKLLVQRYRRGLSTVITTNLPSMNDIEKRYGARIVDRLIETYDRITFAGRSYRKAPLRK